ncbi:15-hydroxyprostaglandin dehydrogenase [NAD(+)]-like [Trichoplusia ni]|uniref:15-hydroxyprostaglandin dehydrogenase [NAD(+)]-like n=1 Tax=Trichoplusia ni TaxID=7111 RepID=A0A7E5WRQ5_TRINI|nr:15-hydroxyprostaglandin dehydrogenase [NAD(+)]-like [Trichoplusia ni]XP_026742841.1 15-hydroxyprostaglandin dehydrogenase [NAD(+)]-like [Trichoplusia ni]
MHEIQDKVCFVTGAAAGIGAVIVRAFLDEGARHVAALDIDTSNGQALQQDLTNKYGEGKVRFHKCDVTTNEIDAVYDNVVNDFGYIDVVVNCAGIMNDRPNAYVKEIEINVTALIRSSFKAFELMRKDHGGRGGTIINISSIVGLFQAHLLPVYTATKSAVLQFSNCLGMDPHASRSGVRVLTLCFGCTDTSLFSLSKMGAFDKETDELLVGSLGKLPMQKIESAVAGLLTAYREGASASTWLVTSDRPAEDITGNISKAYGIMSQGVFS